MPRAGFGAGFRPVFRLSFALVVHFLPWGGFLAARLTTRAASVFAAGCACLPLFPVPGLARFPGDCQASRALLPALFGF